MRKFKSLHFYLKILFSAIFYTAISGTLLSQVPTITSFTPASGQIGTSVTITGTNFSTTASSNFVWFGAAKAFVTYASATQLNVTVPAGATYQPITVTVGGYTAFSATPFKVNFPSSQSITTGSFSSKFDITTGSGPYNSVIGDLDGDGKPDLVVANSSSNTISILQNISSVGPITTGSFASKVDLTTGSLPYGIALGDVDCDGKLDIVVVNQGSYTLSVFRNISSSGTITTGSFATRVDISTAASPYYVAISDIDLDGKPDIIVANNGVNTISIFRNISTPGAFTTSSLSPKIDFSTGSNPCAISVSDLDNDSKPDIVVANYNSTSISILKNVSTAGTVSLAVKVDVTVWTNPDGLGISDIDGDGKPDIIVSNGGSDKLSILSNSTTTGSILATSFSTKTDFATLFTPDGLSISDLDGDGKMDIVVADFGTSSVSVFKNISSTGFFSLSTRVDVPTGSAPAGVSIGDIDSDGKPDIVATNYTGGSVSVLRNIISNPSIPVISSFTPSSGPLGTTVTISGSNFSTTTTNNKVWFGATQATVTAATATQLTVTVPIGATFQPISVTVGGYTDYSSAPFSVTFPSSQTIDVTSFTTKVDFTSGTSPTASAIGDIDGDGKPDLVVANSSSSTISVYRNTSTSGSITAGSFASKVDFVTGTGPYFVAIGDIDGDGKMDIVTANTGSNTVSVFRNTSTSGSITSGSFATKVDFATGTGPYFVAIGDIDGDGKPDLAVSNGPGNSVSILRNISTSGSITTGSFASKVDLVTIANPHGLAISDIDGDGKPDLTVTNYDINTVSVFRNISSPGSISSGSFATKVDFATGSNPYYVVICDIDGDGKPELAVSNYSTSTLSLFRNTSTSGSITTGSLAAKVDFTTGTTPLVITVGDIDGDSKPDLAVANQNSNSISVFRNTSTSGTIAASSLATKVDFTTGTAPLCVVISDIDGDGKPDLSAVNNTGNTVSVLRNTISGPAMPTITSFTPASGSVGTYVTISGTNFNTTATNNSVWFGAVQATVISASATQLVVKVPTGATYQPISVTNVTSGLTAYSSTPFTVTFPSSQVIDATILATKADITTGTSPVQAVLSDIDGDGKPDLIIANFSGSTVSVFRNISSTGTITAGSFSGRVDLSTGSGPSSVAAGDIDGDGKPDLIVTNTYSYTLSVFRNISSPGVITSGSFAARVDYSTGYYPTGVAIGDLDNDGRPEMVVANQQSNTFSIFINSSTPGLINAASFATKVDITTGSSPQMPVLYDLDGDKKLDVIINNFGGTTISVFRNTFSSGSITASTFPAFVDFSVGSKPFTTSVGDLDGDGKPDLVVANQTSNSISILRNVSTSGSITTSSFSSKVDLTTGTSPTTVAMSDIDGDSKPDIIVTNQTSNTFSIFKNISSSGSLTTGSFNSKVDVSTTSGGPYGLVMGDIDGDYKPDIVTTNYSASTFSIFRNIISGPPIINAVTPNSGLTGSSVTISGNNFSSTAANNIVWFGAVQGTVSSSTATQIKTTVPVGTTYQPVSVTVGGLIDYAASPFNLTFPTNQTIDLNSFSTKVDISTGSSPIGIAFADIDGDGKADLIVANSVSATISVFRNTGTAGTVSSSSFATKVDFSTGTNPHGLAVGDLDGDGKQDIVVTNYGSNTVSVFRNTSTSGSITTSSLSTKVDFATGSAPEGIVLFDIDGDGKLEIITVNYTANTISVLRNTGSSGSMTLSSFATKVDFATGSSPYDVAIGDIDGDGKPDMASVNYISNTISLFRNTSTSGTITSGSFTLKVDIPSANAPRTIDIVDIDGDGKSDLVTTNFNGGSISVFRNISSAGSISASSFAAKTDFSTGTGPSSLAIGDLDGDGKPDLAVTNGNNGSGSTLSILKNNSTPGSITSSSIGTKVDFSTVQGPACIAIGDIDNDGKPDLAVTNVANAANSVSLFRNTTSSLTVPTISSVSPGAGSVGASTTITGTNFSTTAASNTVWFGATKGTVTAATATQLTVTVPSGANYQPLSVTVSNLTGYASKPFNTTFTSSQIINSNTFQTKVDFLSGTTPLHTAIGDIDGDGKPDLVAVNSASSTVSVYRNVSSTGSVTTSSFSTKVDLTTGTTPNNVALADIDGDGKLDMIIVNSGSNFVSVFRNTATSGTITTSSFASMQNFSTGTSPSSVTFGDVDGDGRPDLAVTNSGASTVSILKNTSSSGNISFLTKVDFASGSNPNAAAFTDVDADGKADLVVVTTGSNSISVYRNICSYGSITASSFASKIDFTTGSSPYNIAVGDIDGDGLQDIIVTNYGSNSLSVFRNNGLAGSITSGSLLSKVDFATGTNPNDIVISDFDGDGKPDIAVTNYTDNTISVFQNTSTSGTITTASLNPKADITVGTAPYGISAGDLDNDGKPDIVYANSGGSSVSVLRNNIALKLVISSITPTSGAIGATVTINGANFNTTLANNAVWFGATKASISVASASQLTLTVPTGATYQPITVTNTGSGLTSSSGVPFNVTFGSSQIFDANAFAAKVDLTTASGPYYEAIADIDGDGKSDLIVTDYTAGSISIFRNTSTSGTVSYANKVDYATGSNPNFVAVGDLDGDGKQDIVVTNATSNTISIFKNNSTSGSISLGTKVDLTTVSSPAFVAIGDIDGDNKPELAVTFASTYNLTLFQNSQITGTITASGFATSADFTTLYSPTGIVIGDLNGDSKPEVIVANNNNNSISVFKNTSLFGTISTSSLATKVDFTSLTKPNQLALGDLDGDGKTDICVTNSSSNYVSVFRNTSTSAAISATRYDFVTGGTPTGIAISDIDGDGKPDIATANYGAATFSVLKNNTVTTPSFATKVDYTIVAGSSPMGISIGDLDGDGKPDISVVNNGNSSVSIFRNNLLLPPTAPVVGTITQPTCKATTGSVALSGLPSTGTWTITRTPGGTQTTGTGTTTTITGLSAGTYTFTVYISTNGTSPASSSVTINAVPKGVVPKIKAKWNDLLICYNVGDSITTYQWYKATSLLVGATSQTYLTNKSAGVYKVLTVDKNGCSNYSDPLTMSGTKSLNIYPNPAKESVTVTLNDEQLGKAIITIISPSGMKVMEVETDKDSEDFTREIPVDKLGEGVYIIRVTLNKMPIYSSKIMIIK